MKKVNRRKMDDSANHNIWRSYSDMMSGLLLLFILIMAVCLMQAQKNYAEKLAEQAKQLQTQNELELSQQQVTAQQSLLDEQESELQLQEMTLAEQASALEELQLALEEQRITLNEKESEVDAQNALLAQQAEDLALSQSQLDEANALMVQQQAKIDQIIGVKADLIEELNQEFRANQISVEIDTETGAILLDSSVMFEVNQSKLTYEGTQVLDQILPIYCQVLLQGDYADYVAEIIIDGYTDSVGTYIDNLELSQSRAFAVAEYLYGTMDGFLSEGEQDVLRSKLTANGKSFSNPILDENGNEDKDASRRVEVKFRLKDEEMMSELQKLIEDSKERQ